jgi:hypothetical protein
MCKSGDFIFFIGIRLFVLLLWGWCNLNFCAGALALWPEALTSLPPVTVLVLK